MSLERKKEGMLREKLCVHNPLAKELAEDEEVAQPSRFVKDK